MARYQVIGGFVHDNQVDDFIMMKEEVNVTPITFLDTDSIAMAEKTFKALYRADEIINDHPKRHPKTKIEGRVRELVAEGLALVVMRVFDSENDVRVVVNL